MGGGLRLLTWLLKRIAPLRKPNAQQLGGGISPHSTCLHFGGTGSGGPLCCPSPSQAAKPRASPRPQKPGFSMETAKGQKEPFPVWHRAPRAQGIYSSASSAGAASPSAAASAAEPLPRAGQKEEPCDFGGAGSQQRGRNALCLLCKTPSPPSP